MFHLTEDWIHYNMIARGEYRHIYQDYDEVRYDNNGYIQEGMFGYTREMILHTPDNTFITLANTYTILRTLQHIGNPNYDICWEVNSDHINNYSHIYSRFVTYLQ